MKIYERIKLLRKSHLKLTQAKFGERVGVNRDVIKNIEQNLLARPDQKEPLYRLICKTFNISYDWLTAGIGEMILTTEDNLVLNLSERYNLDDIDVAMLKGYLRLSDEQKGVIKEYIVSVAKEINLDIFHVDVKSAASSLNNRPIETIPMLKFDKSTDEIDAEDSNI